MPKQLTTIQRLSRREAFRLMGAAGATALVGRSLVVGKPVAMLLLERDATVTICHSRTRDLMARTSEADVLVAAVGRPRMLGAEHIGPGALVIDVGTTPDAEGNLVGDVDTDARGILADAYQTFAASSILARVCQPEFQALPSPPPSRLIARSTRSPVGAISYSR